MNLKENERIDYVNDRLGLIQDTDGLTFGTDALLLAGYIDGKRDLGIELGSGSGIISMLLLTRNKIKRAICLEVQAEYADLTARNAELNGLSESMECVNIDARQYRPDGECDIVYSNPPYMKADSGRVCGEDKKTVARHEMNGDIVELCESMARTVKYGGAVYIVYRPDRAVDLIAAMRGARLEPKRMTLVHADTESKPSMMLVEAKRGAKSGLKLTQPFIIYKDKSHTEYTDAMCYVMDNGSFPKEYLK